jgi:hypothetical protein
VLRPRRLPAGRGVFAVMSVLLLGAILPLVASGPAAAFASAALRHSRLFGSGMRRCAKSAFDSYS